MRPINLNKKAILMKELINIVMAVVVIVLLFVLAYLLYTVMFKKTERAQAQATLTAIIGKMTSLKEGEHLDYIITAPNEWYFVYFDKTEKVIPTQCQKESCLCICQKKADVQTCDLGICKKVNERVQMLNNMVTNSKGDSEVYIAGNYFIKKTPALISVERVNSGILGNFVQLSSPYVFGTGTEDLRKEYAPMFENLFSSAERERILNFLSSKSKYLNKGIISFRDQIADVSYAAFLVEQGYKPAGNTPRQEVIEEYKKRLLELTNNILQYFNEIKAPIRVALKGLPKDTTLESIEKAQTQNFFRITAGGQGMTFAQIAACKESGFMHLPRIFDSQHNLNIDPFIVFPRCP